MAFKEKLYSGTPLVIDGAMGTMLFREIPDYQGSFELLNIERPEIIEKIHRLYFEAGAEIVETNTFGGNKIKLDDYGLGDRCSEINEKGAAVAKKAAREYNGFIGGSVGPTGMLVEPMGDFPAEEIYRAFSLQCSGLERGGADAIIIETMNDIQEARLALLAARDATSLPVVCSMTFEENGKTMTGTDMLTAFATLSQCGADAVGANCSMGPDGLLDLFKKNIDAISELGVPFSVWSNAGLPEIVDGEAVYTLSPDNFARISSGFAVLGVSIIGGCCGTNPDHIRALKERLKNTVIKKRVFGKRFSHLTSRSSSIDLKKHSGLLILGERLNPTARKQFALELKEGKQAFLRTEARKQVEEGAHVLDINVGVPGINEVDAMGAAVATLSGIVNAPLMIDSDNSSVIERALMVYPGVPIVNSINGKDESLRTLVPILKRHGCFVVGLCLDDSGIHPDAAGRISAGDRLVRTLEDSGIDPGRIFIDPLMLAESAEPGSAMETLKVIEHFSKKGIKTSLGISNISFGLPRRKEINNVFLSMAVSAGLTAAIINSSTMRIIDSCTKEEEMARDFLTGKDPGAQKYIESFSKSPDQKVQSATHGASDKDIMARIYALIVEGNSEEIAESITRALKERTPEDIMNLALLKGLEKVGDLYSSGEYFLPQMIASANAMKKGFALLRPLLAAASSEKAGKIVICTVKGDIHDIGKNIVSMMLENHGFQIHDLGKDVSSEDIIRAVRDEKPDILCLSSLLTTTMKEMKKISDLLIENGLKVNLVVGGAVVTEEYARSIGAHYGKDAVHGVRIARELTAK